MLHPTHPFRIYAVAGSTTLLIWALTTVLGGWQALISVIILTLLEVTFSFDNAIINSRVLGTLSILWQRLFMTVGIFIAVFVVRFALPIVIVSLSAHVGFADVVQLALYHPGQYSDELHKAGPIIDAFGGTFLLMIGVSYFVDKEKELHWLRPIEPLLSRAGQLNNLVVLSMLLVAVIIFFTIGQHEQVPVLIACVLGVGLHSLLTFLSTLFGRRQGHKKIAHKTGLAAFVSFLYLEVLDGSFSFDSVIGAFAITSNVLIIMAGLGAGAIWVRSMTVHLLRAGTLAKYRYLEHGAHWAIIALGIILLVKLYGIEPPDILSGLIGISVIALSIFSSIRHSRQVRSS